MIYIAAVIILFLLDEDLRRKAERKGQSVWKWSQRGIIVYAVTFLFFLFCFWVITANIDYNYIISVAIGMACIWLAIMTHKMVSDGLNMYKTMDEYDEGIERHLVD